MKKLLPVYLLILLSNVQLLAQSSNSNQIYSPLQVSNTTADLTKVFDKTFGGTLDDKLIDAKQTSDGGYVLAGYSESGQNGDKTQGSQGNIDYWIIKINASGTKVWDKRFGGAGFDYIGGIQPTADGGCILAGYSDSGISGDKTQATQGGSDFWIIKIDANGTKVWDKDFGGAGYEYLSAIQPTSDGGFILGGYTDSGISGDKTQASQGGNDYWVLKIDGTGAKVWDKSFGGSSAETLSSLLVVSDGILVGGFSTSGISGNKSQASQGGNDYWVVKIGPTGTLLWDKRFGGLGEEYLKSMQVTAEGNYVIGGYSYSGISGDKSQASQGGADFWILKIDPNGAKIWDKRFGGSGDEQLTDIKIMSNGGLLLAGNSLSGISGDKSQASQGGADYWVLNTDASGVKILDKGFGGSSTETLSSLQFSADGGFVLNGYSTSGIGGDKSQAAQGGADYWIVKVQNCQLSPPTIVANGNQNICSGNSVSISAPSVPTTGISYQWQKDGVNFSTQNIISVTNAGTYSLKITDAQGCTVTASNTMAVAVGTLPTSTITAQSATTICAGNNVTLSGAVGTGYTYQWIKDGTTITGATSKDYVATAAGAFTLKTTSADGCFSTSAATNVSLSPSPPTPVLVLSGPTSLCPGASINMSVTSSAGLTYQWYKDGTAISGAITNTYISNVAGGFSLKTTSTTSTCSSTSAVTTVVIAPPPTVAITPQTATRFCPGGSVVLSGTAGTGYSYQWFIDGTIIAGATNQTYTASSLGNYDLSIITPQGCTAKTSTSTLVSPYTAPAVPSINTGSSATICAGDISSLVAISSSVDITGYQWLKDNVKISGATNKIYSASIGANYAVIATNAQGCSSTSANFLVLVNPVPNASITTPSTTICSGETSVLQATAGTGYVYQWLQDGIAISGANTQSYSTKTSGNFSIRITTDKNCSSTSAVTSIVVNPLPITPAITAKGLLTFCPGSSVPLVAKSSSGVSFLWLKDGVATTAKDSVISVTTAGAFSVKASYPTGCSTTSLPVSTFLYDSPNKTITLQGDATFCKGATTILSAVLVSGQTYQWFQNGSSIFGATTANLSVNNSGKYMVKLTSLNGCLDSSAVTTITVNPLPATPEITADGPTTFCGGGSVTLKITPLTGAKYQWYSDNITTVVAGATDATYKVTTSNAYGVKVTDSNGCSAFSNNFVPITVITVPKPTITQNDGVLVSSATAGNQWFLNSVEIVGSTAQQLNLVGSGKYVVQVSQNGCKSPLSDEFVPIITANEDELSVIIYPNPAQESLRVNNVAELQLTLIDGFGRRILSKTIQQNAEIMIQDLARGLYIVELSTKEGKKVTKKVVLQ